ncbi:MAG: response regulator [Pseudomonadota bacterium]
MTEAKLVHIVDDDSAVRDALSVVFEVEGYATGGFANGNEFLDATNSETPDCVLLDVHMPGKSGLDILRELQNRKFPAPVFIISGQGDIPMAVQAIKDGAFDFIEKPFDATTVLERVAEAISASARKTDVADNPGLTVFPGRELLTPREAEVLNQIASGASNKEAGRTLGISPRTVEVHRARIMEKLGARNAADLVRIVLSTA